jgi:signal transduction histidine kinase
MAAKLRRLSATTQDALKQFACLGNAAETFILILVQGERMHTAFGEAVHAGLVVQQERAYKFLHDRIQQAAYSLIPDGHRADVHLRIGRVLLASMTSDQLAEHLFDVANQLNQGAARLIDRDGKAEVATINLRAGRKAKASAAYASALAYFSAGIALLDENDWSSQYELAFKLLLARAECEFLTGHFEEAEQLIAELLQRAASKVDEAAVYDLKVRLDTLKSEPHDAVATALTCLRRLGIDIPGPREPDRDNGQLSASIAHEVNQPIAALLTNAETAVRWLARQPPNLEKAKPLIDRVISDGKRTADIVSRIRNFSQKAPAQKGDVEPNEAILEITGLTHVAASEHGVVVKLQQSDGLPHILGDRVQLQQVILNLIMNAIEAMSEVSEGPRELLISTSEAESGGVLVAVGDSGPGLPQANLDRLFEAFYTTKANGLGMGLSILPLNRPKP